MALPPTAYILRANYHGLSSHIYLNSETLTIESRVIKESQIAISDSVTLDTHFNPCQSPTFRSAGQIDPCPLELF